MKKINLFMSFKQQLLVNNINMSTSLPKIKTLAQQSETGSQKQLKFKKLKLNTDQSAADIREKFKSVRTERLSSLQRYSTVEGQREHKKQKIHLNLLQRKLMSGTYDEKQQTGNDLNFLKQKTDLYKTQWTQRQLQTEKVRQMIEEIKVEIQNYQIIKQKNDEAVAKVQRKFDQQKLKTEAALSEKSCLQHMISERKKVNHFVESKINEDKAYLTKLKAIVKQVFTQARQSTESMKNLMLKIDKINDEALRQQRSREQIMYEKQSVINRRKDDQKLRELKSKQFKKTLDEGELELEKKDFMDLYKGILSHVFLQKYCRQTMQSLQQKYQVMENYYEKISSYKKFQSNQPNLMIERYKNLNPETADLEDKIKKLEQKQLQFENKNNKLSDKLKEVDIIGNKNQEQNLKLIRNKSEIIEKQEIKQKEHERKIQNVKQEIDEINETVHKVERWGDRYAKQFEIKSRRSQDPEELGRNIVNIIKVVLKQSQGLDKKKTKTQQIEQK